MPEYFGVIFNWLLWNIAFLLTYKYVKKYAIHGIGGFEVNNIYTNTYTNTYTFVFMVFLLYSLFTFYGGDEARYRQMILEYSIENDIYISSNFENVYVKLAQLCGGVFLLWKLMVYGLSLLLVHYTLRKLKVDNLLSLFAFAGFCLVSYGATRAVLAYSIYILGLSFLHDKNIFSLVLGWSVIICSYFFHNSMLAIIALTPLVYIKLKKKYLVLLLLLFPVVQIGFNYLVGIVGDYVSFLGEYTEHKFSEYTTEEGGGGTGRALSLNVQYLIDYILLIYFLFLSFKADFKNRIPQKFQPFLYISFYIIYFALLIRFSPLYNSFYLFTRYYSIVPFLCFLLFVPFYNRYMKQFNKNSTLFNLLALRGNYLFMMYIYLKIMNQ